MHTFLHWNRSRLAYNDCMGYDNAGRVTGSYWGAASHEKPNSGRVRSQQGDVMPEIHRVRLET